MDQSVTSRELPEALGARKDVRETVHEKQAERRMPANRAAKQRMERELRAQGMQQEAINRLLHL